MAVKTINQKITLSGGDEIARSLRDLARLGEETFNRLAAAANKIDINLPVDKVKQQLQDLARTGQQAFAQLGQAAQQAGQQIANVGAGTQPIQQLSAATKEATSSVGTLSSVINSVPGRIAIVSAAVVGLATAWTSMAKSASEAVLSIGRAADRTGVSIEQFTRAKLLLTQLGLSSEQAEAAIKRLGEVTGGAMGKAIASLEQGGQRFNQFTLKTEEGRRALIQTVEQLSRVTVNGRAVFDEATAAVLRYGLAFNPVTGQALRTTQSLTELADALTRIPDPAKRAQVITALFGADLAKVLIPALQRGTAEFVNTIGQIDRLRLRVTDADRAVSQNFMRSWQLLQEVLKANTREIGLLIAKPLTPFIMRFAEAMRTSEPIFKLFEAAVKAIQPALDDLLKLLEGRGGEIRTPWILEAEKALKSLGEAALVVLIGVIVPALKTLESAGTAVANTFNQVFGTNITGPMLLLGAALTALIGGFKTLAIVILAAFASTDKGLNPVQAALASIGVNIEELKAAIVEAWEEIKQAFAGFDIGQALKDFITSIPGIITAIAGLLVFLNRWIGITNLARLAVLQFTGLLPVLTFALVSLGAVSTIVINSMNALRLAVVGIAAAFGASSLAAAGWLAGAIIAIGILIYNIDLVIAAFGALQRAGFGATEIIAAALIALAPVILNVARGAATAALAFIAMATPLIQAAVIFGGLLILMQDFGIVTSATAKRLAELQKEQEKVNLAFARGDISDAERIRRTQAIIAEQEKLLNAQKAVAAQTPEVASGWRKAVDDILAQLGRVPAAAENAGNQAATTLKGAAGKISGGFREVSPGRWERIRTETDQAADAIVKTMDAAGRRIEAGFIQVSPGRWELIRQEANQTVQDVVKNTNAATTEVQTTLQNSAQQVSRGYGQVFSELWSLITTGALTAAQNVNRAFADIKVGTVTGDTKALQEGLERAAADARKLDQNLDNLSIPPAVQRFLDEGLPEGQVEDRRGEFDLGASMKEGVAQALVQIQTMVDAAVAAIIAQFQTLGPAFSASLLQLTAVDPFAILVTAAQSAVAAIVAVFAELGGLLLVPFQTAQSGIGSIMFGIQGLVQATFQSLLSSIQAAAASVQSAIAQIISSLQAAVAEAQALAAAAQKAASEAAKAGSSSGFASGGYTGDIGTRRVAGVVHGGEYVEPARVVRQPGVRAFLETLRRVGDLREAIRRFSRGFSIGGFVDGLSSRMASALVPGFAGGGMVPQPASVGGTRRDLGVLRLEVGGETLQVLTDETTAFKLQRFARRQKMTAGGRVPTWER